MFSNDVTNKSLISKIHKQLIELSNEKQNQTTQSKNEQNTSTDISQKKTYRLPTFCWKDA